MSRTSVKLHAVAEHASSPPVPGVAVALHGAHTAEMGSSKGRRALQLLGDRVRQLRIAKGWTRTLLARRAQVTVATIRGCEEGTKVTQPEKLGLIAHALGVSTRRLEIEEKDPRIRNWTDEDFEIGNWYHNMPRQLKNRIWSLYEVPDAGHAVTDPQFTVLLEGWAALTQAQKVFVLNSFDYIKKLPNADDTGGFPHALASADPKVRGPVR